MGAYEDLFADAESTARPAPPLHLELAVSPSPPPPVAERFEFFVHGEPRPKGSKSAFVVRTKGGAVRAVVTDTTKGEGKRKLYSWTDSVTAAAIAARGERDNLTTAVRVSMTFYLARPAGHFNAKGALKPSAPRHHATKPDVDKLARSTLDALKVGMLSDDSRVWDLHLVKRFVGDDGTRETGCRIVVEVTP